MNEITDKTMCLVTHRTGRFFINEKRVSEIIALLNGNNAPKMLELDGNFISVVDIAGIVKASQIDDLERVKRGDWKCKYDAWHERNQTCAHHLVRR